MGTHYSQLLRRCFFRDGETEPGYQQFLTKIEYTTAVIRQKDFPSGDLPGDLRESVDIPFVRYRIREDRGQRVREDPG
jgi:hypothetical protein